MIYKAMFDALSPRWNAYGRAVFVETDAGDPEPEREALARAAAAANYPGAEIRIVAIGESTEAARAAFLERKARERRWMENNQNGIANRRGDL